MKRRLLNLLTALSLLLCAATVALWAANHRRTAGVISTATERRGDGGGEFWVRDQFAQAWRGVLVVSHRRWLLGRRDGMGLLIAVTPGRWWLWEPPEGELVRRFDEVFTADYRRRVEAAAPLHLFAKYSGVMLGDGEAWFAPAGPSEGGGGRVEAVVIALNNGTRRATRGSPPKEPASRP